MKEVLIKATFLFFLSFSPLLLFANTGGDCIDGEVEEKCEDQNVELPKVFLIGEYAEEFEIASSEYSLQLLDACKQDMGMAYLKWLTMLFEMEDYAQTVGLDLKGVKMWIKVFWNEEGGVDHIAYYLKPKSKNIDKEELTIFFTSFMEDYKFPLVTEEKFSHYGSASFPILARGKKDNN